MGFKPGTTELVGTYEASELPITAVKFLNKVNCLTSVCSAKTVLSSVRSGSPYSLPLESMAKKRPVDTLLQIKVLYYFFLWIKASSEYSNSAATSN